MKSKAFFKAALLHSGVIWLVLQVSDIFNYLFNNINIDDAPFITAIANRFVNHNVYQTIWVDVLLLCFTAEFNWYVVFTKYRSSVVKFAIASIGLSLLFTGLHLLHAMAFTKLIFIPSYFTTPLLYLLYTGTYIFIRNYFQANKLKAEQTQQNIKAELNTLKAQLNPHFFFNTLNNIYGTALMENASSTADAIDKLSSLVRYTMAAMAKDDTPITDEIGFINNYLQLQALRLPNRNNISIQKEISYDDDNVKIAPLLIIPFLENAFKYGISVDKECCIIFLLEIKNSHLLMKLKNTIVSIHHIEKGNGTGIANTVKRLALLYPGKHNIDIANDGQTFNVKMEITL